jgi:hypothetical protein
VQIREAAVRTLRPTLREWRFLKEIREAPVLLLVKLAEVQIREAAVLLLVKLAQVQIREAAVLLLFASETATPTLS